MRVPSAVLLVTLLTLGCGRRAPPVATAKSVARHCDPEPCASGATDMAPAATAAPSAASAEQRHCDPDPCESPAVVRECEPNCDDEVNAAAGDPDPPTKAE